MFFNSKVRVFTQELRVSDNGGGPFRYTVGAFYDNETLREVYRSDFVDAGFSGNAYTPYRQKVESISGFGQLEYQVTPALNLIAGGRYEFEARRLIGIQTSLNITQFPNGFTSEAFPQGVPVGTVIPFVTPQNRRVTLNDWSGKVAAEWKIAPDVLLLRERQQGGEVGRLHRA